MLGMDSADSPEPDSTLPSGLPAKVGNDEDLARFLTSSSHYNQVAVKPAAFMPSSDPLETSVSRHGKEPLDDLISLGSPAAGNRNLYGAAVVKTFAALETGLTVESAEPPDRHAAIRSWPVNDQDKALEKASRKEKALVLASASEKILFSR